MKINMQMSLSDFVISLVKMEERLKANGIDSSPVTSEFCS